MEKFWKIYKSLIKDRKNNFVVLMKTIIQRLDIKKNMSYARNIKHSVEEYVAGIIEVLTNNISWRRYNGKINGRVLNNKHNEYVKLGVYDELYKINLKKYLRKNKKRFLKYLSMDSSFVENINGINKIGRNIYYKNKQGRKITAIVDSKGIPLNICLSEGNKHDCSIFKENEKMIEKASMKEQYFMADKGYDSKEIRKILKEKGYISIIPKRKNKKNKKSLNKNEIRKYKKRIIVENTFSWLKRNAKISKIYEKKLESYVGLLLLCISILIYKRI
jgi:transposase